MNSPWLSYLPYHVAADILKNPERSPIGRVQHLSVVALFADVSGFTAISEALGRTGRLGTEELTNILNSYFEPMIGLIHTYGGVVAKFGGDALTVFFPLAAQNDEATVHRAIQCALAMQANMDRYRAIETSAGVFSLTMKAGLAIGTLFCTTVGQLGQRLEYVLAGSVLDRCADAEHKAAQGEVVAHNDLFTGVAGVEVIREQGAFSWIGRLHPQPDPKPQPPLPSAPGSAINLIANFLHPAIAQRLQTGQTGFINEHRLVTTLFVRFTGFDYDDDPQVGEKLQAYLTKVIQIIDQYGGYLNKVDMGDKGSKVVILFGAPVGHEDDEERAIRCALELVALPDVPVHIGVSTGFVYCGQVGAATRQEYTVMGDSVNLAARLMQLAEVGQILLSQVTWQAVSDKFISVPLDAIQVKGKTDPIFVYAVQGLQEQTAVSLLEPSYSLPMVGRTAELEQIQFAMTSAQQGQGQVIGIVAEAGMGKSRLGSEIVKIARERGFDIHGGACQSYGTATSYLAWRDVWRRFFRLSANYSIESQIRHLHTQLSLMDRRLVARLPMLGPAVNLPIADNELTQSLDAQLKAELLKSLLLDCLRQRAQDNPLFIILEDCHWLDALSQELLAFIGRNLADLPILLVTLYRPSDAENSPLGWATFLDPVQEIHLTDFTENQAEELALLKLKQLWPESEAASPEFLQQIITKAAGNPFYLEEMINFIRDQQISPHDQKALAELKLPDSLHNLIISRIDQLPEAEKSTLKVASVIGRIFPSKWIWGSYPQIGSADTVQNHLRVLARVDLTPLHESGREPTYLFKHITTQEVSYESMALATRSTLHEQVAQFIEREYADSLPQYTNELAYHYGRNHHQDKQRHYFRLAADTAKAAFANEAAIEYYQRLLSLTSPFEQGVILLELGRIKEHIGQWAEAESHYREVIAQARATGNDNLLAESQLSLGRLLLLSRTDSPDEALQWLQQAQEGFRQVGNQSGLGQVMEQLSFAYFNQGNFSQTLTFAEQRLQIAQADDDPVGISGAYNYMGLARFQGGDFSQALADLEQSLQTAAQNEYHRGIILACNDLAGVHFQQGDYGRSLTYLQQAQTASNRIGYREGSGLSIGNAGRVYAQVGDYASAQHCYEQSLQIAAELGDWSNIVAIIGNMADLMSKQRVMHTEQLFNRAIELARSLNLPHFLCEFLYGKGLFLTQNHQYRVAKPLVEEAVTVAVQVEQREILFQAQVLAVHLQVALGEMDGETAVHTLTTMREEWSEDKEQAALSYEIWRLSANPQAQIEAADLYRQLYNAVTDVIYQERYQRLTGATLPVPPTLPPILEADINSVNLQSLLRRVGVQLGDD